MAVETHGVTASEVLEDTPLIESRVSASGDGVTTNKIDKWIKRAAGQINAILVGRSISPGSIGENLKETVRGAITAYAQAKALTVAEYPGDRIDDAWEEYRALKKIIRSNDRDAGGDIDKGSEVRSNVDTSDDKESTTWGTEYAP